ncbi:TonB-dependent receptor [Neptunitalea lumnitzerae]|nr:TonB-dependent receptor [Neptunitalea sp. Y10]
MNHLYFKLLMVVGVLLVPSTLLAQLFTGVVTNSKRNPLANVYVLNLEKNTHAHTNEEGVFELNNVQIGDTLQFVLMGYTEQKLVVSSLDKLVVVVKEKDIELAEVTIGNKINALRLITDIDIQMNPVNSSQDVLRKVPGLFIGQHAGGGKSEQMFLRGFDLDHGTDIAITVDDMPVNMVSHAHGQGYADLHFVIPETIDNIDFGKGPYYADKGNFSTAAYVNFTTKNQLQNSSVKLEGGQFDSWRLLGMFNVLNTHDHHAYVATEYLATDGYFDSSQNFNRINLFAKYTGDITEEDKLQVLLSHFTSSWDASGQIPQRAVDSGLIGRFGAIDDTEGGLTDRTNLSIRYDKILDEHSFIKNTVFYSHYDFELYSNFTFFLEDPINGDQIKQKESRNLYGLQTEYNHSKVFNNTRINWQAGFSLRNDVSTGNELAHTVNRSETLNYIQQGDINETNMGGYVNVTFEMGRWIINPSLRADYFNFQYNDYLQTNYETQAVSESTLSPKLNVFYNATDNFQAYVKSGKGFHSNDTRVVVVQDGKKILPSAYGLDVGYIWKPVPNIFLNMAYWNLYLDQEFVYVGDAGVVEPSGKTSRQGVDVSVRYQPVKWLFWNIDANYTKARAIDEPTGEDYIPLAPEYTLVSGLNVKHDSGMYGGLNLRYLGDRPANEDNSIVADGYTVVDFNVGYTFKQFDLGVQIQNLFDVDWNETQFATESRLQNETTSVEEIHFTPGTPFFVKAYCVYRF